MFNFKIHAPEFNTDKISFVNTKPFTLTDLRGNILLLDFWTYCCINCIHTVPDLQYLEEKFRKDSVNIVGIHSAKFDNENNVRNVLQAINRYEIEHPIILDQEHAIWDSFAIRAWPSLVLIDAEGYIRKGYSGEGHREELQHDIASLLSEGEKKSVLKEKYTFTFTQKREPSLLYYPGKLSIMDDTIAIANANRNNVLIGDLYVDHIELTQTIGNGEVGTTDGESSQASFNKPQSVLLKKNEAFVADTDNNRIRHIDLKTNTVDTVNTGNVSSPWDLALHHDQLYVALAGSHQIGVYDIAKKKFSIFAGNRYENIVDGYALQASLAQTSGLSITGDTLYFADSETSSIRYCFLKEPYIVNTIVGYGLFDFGFQDGTFDTALFQHPLGLCADGNIIYVADTYNSAIREIELEKQIVSTLIKPKTEGVCMIGDKECNVLSLYEPADVKKWQNNLIISDTNNHLIRRYDLETKDLITLEIA